MAKLYITEFTWRGQDGNSAFMGMAGMPKVASQTVAIGGASAQSAAFNDETTYIKLHTDAICSVEINANPTATTDINRMAANSSEYIGVPKGKSYKIAVIANT